MGRYIVKRLLEIIPVLFIITFIVFSWSVFPVTR